MSIVEIIAGAKLVINFIEISLISLEFYQS